jgi:hypothetical protein
LVQRAFHSSKPLVQQADFSTVRSHAKRLAQPVSLAFWLTIPWIDSRAELGSLPVGGDALQPGNIQIICRGHAEAQADRRSAWINPLAKSGIAVREGQIGSGKSETASCRKMKMRRLVAFAFHRDEISETIS